MLQIDPFNSSYSQKNAVSQKQIKAISTPKEQFFGESICCRCQGL